MSQTDGWSSDPVALAALALSLVACIGSVIAWLKSHKVQKRQVEIAEKEQAQRQRLQLEANLGCELIRNTGTGPRLMLRIRNTGQAQARNIVVGLDGLAAAEHPALLRATAQGLNANPDVLGPGGSFDYVLAPRRSHDRTAAVEITWTDDSGEQERYSTNVNLY